MSSVAEKLRALQRDLEAMGRLPLLPAEDFEDYSAVCAEVIDVVAAVCARPADDPTPEATVELMCEIARSLRRAGDDLTATDILAAAARHAEARHLGRLASHAHNLAGINLYCLGEYDEARAEFDRALAALADDDYGAVRSLLVRMNRGNVDHDLGRYGDAERVFLELLACAGRVPGDVFAAHAPFDVARFRGMLCHNICTNRIEWARREAADHDRARAHLAVAERYLAEALELPLAADERVQALTNQAAMSLLGGDPVAAEARLLDLATHCAAERELMDQLPELYRYAAEACAAQGETRRAVVNCYRALESSLAVADRLQERRVVETFVAALRLSSTIIIERGATASRKAALIEAEARPLVDRLVDFLERKDWYTGHSHSRAVERISVRIAKAMCAEDGAGGEPALRDIEWNTLRLAAALHDIGKLAVPWSLLNKLLPLTPGDRAILRRHPEAGRDILRDVGLGEIGDVVVEHHEAPDGSGYPTGRRDSSPMGAIVAVADAFEAMTTVNRRYRTPKRRDEAVREVLALAGKQFDARVASALARTLSHSA